MTPLFKLDLPQAEASSGLECSVMEDTLGKLEQDVAVITSPDAAAMDVVNQMRSMRTGCALVVDGKQLAGIFTEHDVLTKLTGDGATQDGIRIRDLMSRQPDILNEKDSVAAALNKMSMGRYRHIPVVKNDGTYAVISIKSVLNYISREDW
jgi:CBS domain-containing protein